MPHDEHSARVWLTALPEWTPLADERLELLAKLLTAENALQNLVSASSLASIWQRHVADSAQLLQHVPRETAGPWLDLGAGAGFPGLVVAALWPELEVVLVESRARRIDWLERARLALDLTQVRVVGAELKKVAAFPAATISARAFAPLPRIIELAARFSTTQTVWLLPKGRSAAQELHQLSGWAHNFRVEPSISDPEAGIIAGQLIGKKGHIL